MGFRIVKKKKKLLYINKNNKPWLAPGLRLGCSMIKSNKSNITKKNKNCTKKSNVSYSFYLKQQFHQKNIILREYFTEIPPLLFFEDYFLKKNEYITGVFEGYGFKQVHCDDIVYYYSYNNFYIFYNNYFNDFVSSKTLKSINWLIIDVDNITANDLKKLITQTIKRIKYKPSFIVNSGGGIHVLYHISEEQAYFRKIPQLRALNLAIQKRFENTNASYKVDIHGLTQAYRLPGSYTKAGDISTIFLVNDKIYTAKELADWLRIKWEESGEKKQKNQSGKNNTNSSFINEKVATMPRAYGGQNFYYWLLRQKEKIQVGSRYMYLFSLSVVAYKCRVKRECLLQDIYNVANYFNSRDSEKICTSEVQRAMQGYSQKFVCVRWETMMQWMGTINSTVKRNYRSREEHLLRCNAIRSASSEYKARKAKELYMRGVSKTEIAKILGLSRRQVYRLLKKV